MDSDGVPVDLDYTKVEAINPRRTNAFVNNFITTSNHFVNRYLASCEERLADIEQAETHLTVLVATLEAKLNSVAYLQQQESVPAPPPPVASSTPTVGSTGESTTLQSGQPPTSMGQSDETAPPPPPPPAPEETGNRVPACKHPVYKRYFDMKKYGVPDGQILLNMRTQGVNPELVKLDKPDELIEVDDAVAAVSQPTVDSSASSSQESDEFSD